jgi:hypothetical protein
MRLDAERFIADCSDAAGEEEGLWTKHTRMSGSQSAGAAA